MMTEQEYQRNLIRMFDSIRDEYKGDKGCSGVRCADCPFFGKVCKKYATDADAIFNAHEAIEIVENWAKQHPIVTNADKFKEVFGAELHRHSCVNANIQCKECQYFDGSECAVRDRFWNAEYKGQTEKCDRK